MKSMIKYLFTVVAISLSDKLFRVIYDMITARIDDNMVLATYSSIGSILGITSTIISGITFGATVYYNTNKNREISFSSSLYTVLGVASTISISCIVLRAILLRSVGVSSDMYYNSELALIGCCVSLTFSSLSGFMKSVLIINDKAKICLMTNIVCRTVKIFMMLSCNSLRDIVVTNVIYDIVYCVIMIILFYKYTQYTLHRLNISGVLKILAVGLPVIIYSSCYPVGNFALSREINKIGVSALSASSVVFTLEYLVYCFYDATWDLVAKYVGDYVRENKLYKVNGFIRDTFKIIIVFHTIFIVVTLFTDTLIFNIIGLKSEYQPMCRVMFRIYLYTCILDGFADIYYATMNTIKEVKLTSLCPLFTIGLIRVLYVHLFYIEGNIASLYMVYPVSYIVNLVTIYIVYKRREEYSY